MQISHGRFSYQDSSSTSAERGGIRFIRTDYSLVEDCVVEGNGRGGSYLDGFSDHNLVRRTQVIRCDGLGGAGIFNSFENIVAAGNSNIGLLVNGNWGRVSGLVAVNNATGLSMYGTSEAVNVLAANNGTGVELTSSGDAVLANVTSVNNTDYGIHVLPSGGAANRNVLLNVASVNNGANEWTEGAGVRVEYGSKTLISNLVSAAASPAIDLLMSSDTTLAGVLKIGGAPTGCWVFGGTSPGLDNSCVTQVPSTATASTGINMTGTFVGRINTGGDAANAHGASVMMHRLAISDWGHFDHGMRAWAPASAPFPDPSSQGWDIDEQAIWDWSLRSADTGDAGAPVLHNVLSPPADGNAVLQKPLAAGGSVAFLVNAVEVMFDGVGNDDGLCNSNETCLVTPNIGSYQGHGALVPAGQITTGGAVENVTLVRYASNGR